MPTLHKVIPKEYRDSVALMQLSAALAKLPDITQASAVMGTENNLNLLRQADLGCCRRPVVCPARVVPAAPVAFPPANLSDETRCRHCTRLSPRNIATRWR